MRPLQKYHLRYLVVNQGTSELRCTAGLALQETRGRFLNSHSKLIFLILLSTKYLRSSETAETNTLHSIIFIDTLSPIKIETRELLHPRIMSYKQTQEDEIGVMMSIFSDEFEILSEDVGEVKGIHYAHVNLPDNFTIKWINSKGEKKELCVQYLPPIIYSFTLPELYPAISPPSFHLSCDWLRSNQKKNLILHMNEMWECNKDVILYKWACFLKNDSLPFLSLEEGIDLSIYYNDLLHDEEPFSEAEPLGKIWELFVANEKEPSCSNTEKAGKTMMKCSTGIQTHDSADEENTVKFSQNAVLGLMRTIKDYNKIKKQDAFNKELFLCNICLSTTAGSKCFQFQPCEHIFCKICVQTYLENMLKEGNIQSITCPEGNCKSKVQHSQIKELVDSELFKLYDEALLNVALTSMSDVTVCPIPSCQNYVLYNPKDNPASCSVCRYAFCIYCRMGYHGVEPCSVKGVDKKKLAKDYCRASGKKKIDLEKKHGKKALQNLVSDVLSQEWIVANSKPCPGCQVKIEKRNGCNKMQCNRCSTQFCWLCGKVMNVNPYNHFFAINSLCNGLLFDDSTQ